MERRHYPCKCGHIKNFHQYSPDARHVVCWGQAGPREFCSCLKFKLDNLSFVEELAKEKNLI